MSLLFFLFSFFCFVSSQQYCTPGWTVNYQSNGSPYLGGSVIVTWSSNSAVSGCSGDMYLNLPAVFNIRLYQVTCSGVPCTSNGVYDSLGSYAVPAQGSRTTANFQFTVTIPTTITGYSNGIQFMFGVQPDSGTWYYGQYFGIVQSAQTTTSTVRPNPGATDCPNPQVAWTLTNTAGTYSTLYFGGSMTLNWQFNVQTSNCLYQVPTKVDIQVYEIFDSANSKNVVAGQNPTVVDGAVYLTTFSGIMADAGSFKTSGSYSGTFFMPANFLSAGYIYVALKVNTAISGSWQATTPYFRYGAAGSNSGGGGGSGSCFGANCTPAPECANAVKTWKIDSSNGVVYPGGYAGFSWTMNVVTSGCTYQFPTYFTFYLYEVYDSNNPRNVNSGHVSSPTDGQVFLQSFVFTVPTSGTSASYTFIGGFNIPNTYNTAGYCYVELKSTTSTTVLATSNYFRYGSYSNPGPGGDYYNNDGGISTGLVIGIVAGFGVLLIIVIYFCCCRKAEESKVVHLGRDSVFPSFPPQYYRKGDPVPSDMCVMQVVYQGNQAYAIPVLLLPQYFADSANFFNSDCYHQFMALHDPNSLIQNPLYEDPTTVQSEPVKYNM